MSLAAPPLARVPLDDRILLVTPNMAIEWGYSLYLVSALEPTSETRASALKAVQELEAMADTFPVGGRERWYMNNLRVAANSFAQGVERRKKSRHDSLEAAREEKDSALRRNTRDTRRGGLLQAGFKILLIGGFIFLMARIIFGLPQVQAKTEGADMHYLSLATTLSIALIGAYAKGWWTDRKMVALFKTYDSKVEKANEKYANDVVAEYQLAAETAEGAWRGLTDRRAPVTKAFEQLLLGVIKGTCPGQTLSPTGSDAKAQIRATAAV